MVGTTENYQISAGRPAGKDESRREKSRNVAEELAKNVSDSEANKIVHSPLPASARDHYL